MSWDKYNEARKKAREAEKALNELSEITGSSSKKSSTKSSTKKSTSSKSSKSSSSKKSSSSSSKKTDLSDTNLSTMSKSDIKTAYKNAKTYRWLFVIFAILAIAMLCTLPFSDYFEAKINNTIEREGIIVGADLARNYSTMNISYVDVMQGDCILINLPDGKNMIIDAGSSFSYYNKYGSEIKQRIFDYIDNNLFTGAGDSGVIDYMIMTHPDYDHLSYMKDILARYEVVNMYRPNTYYGYNASESGNSNVAEKQAFAEAEQTRAAENGAKYITEEMYKNTKTSDNKKVYSGYNVKCNSALYTVYKAMYDEQYTSGGVLKNSTIKFSKAGEKITNSAEASDTTKQYTFTFYAPTDMTKLYADWNNYSCMLILEYNGLKYCFTGDTEKEGEADILAKYGDTLPKVDIMDAGHHGSKTSSTQAFIEKLKPSVVICSCDDGSKYGHPDQGTIDRFIANGVAKNCIFTTHLNSNICVALNYNNPDATATEGEEESPYVVGVTKQGEVTITEVKWWYYVSAGIAISAIILLVIIPTCIKKIKKATKKLKN